MTEFLVRLKGKPKEYMDRLIEDGYFKTKSEIVRLGVLEVSMKYLYNDISKE
jgi:Arc/MetJ-type ribon-helix-helix transcriptional regulator